MTGTTQDKSKGNILRNFLAFSEYMNFNYLTFIQRAIVLILLLCTSFEKLSSHPALRQDLNHFIYALRPQIILILFMGNHWSKTPLRSTAVSLSKSPCILFSVLRTVYNRTVSWKFLATPELWYICFFPGCFRAEIVLCMLICPKGSKTKGWCNEFETIG